MRAADHQAWHYEAPEEGCDDLGDQPDVAGAADRRNHPRIRQEQQEELNKMCSTRHQIDLTGIDNCYYGLL